MSFPWAEHTRRRIRSCAVLDERLPLPRLVYNSVGGGYPVPRNLSISGISASRRSGLTDPDHHRHRAGHALQRQPDTAFQSSSISCAT